VVLGCLLWAVGWMIHKKNAMQKNINKIIHKFVSFWGKITYNNAFEVNIGVSYER
jgi:hypothetical protein